MSFNRWLRRLAPLMVALVLLVSACASTTSKYDQLQKDTTGFGASSAVVKKAEQGSTFNKFFPSKEGGYNVIPYQEKKGFAEYKLQQDGKTVAMLSISDTSSVPAAAEKYNAATESISGFPTVDQGSTGTGLLVNGRYQVKVLSRDPAFDREARVAWLQKFDLQGLAQLKAAITPSGKAAAANPVPPESAAVASQAKPGLQLPQLELPSLSPNLQPAS